MPAGKRASLSKELLSLPRKGSFLSKELLSLPRKGSLTEAPTTKFFMTALTKSCTLPNVVVQGTPRKPIMKFV